MAVGTDDAEVGAIMVLAGGHMLAVEAGEVETCTLVALRRPGTADIGRVAPLETSGALPSGGGDSPWLASPCDACKRDRCRQ